jgi:hypothetical protein
LVQHRELALAFVTHPTRRADAAWAAHYAAAPGKSLGRFSGGSEKSSALGFRFHPTFTPDIAAGSAHSPEKLEM